MIPPGWTNPRYRPQPTRGSKRFAGCLGGSAAIILALIAIILVLVVVVLVTSH